MNAGKKLTITNTGEQAALIQPLQLEMEFIFVKTPLSMLWRQTVAYNDYCKAKFSWILTNRLPKWQVL